MAGDKKDGKKSILRGDDLPAEDAIGSAGASSGSSANESAEYVAPVGVTRWDEADDYASEAIADAKTEFAPGRLELGDEDRLPWLESPDDITDEGVDSGRIIGFVLLALVALVMIVGAVWLASNRASGPGPADGSTLRAESGPYKVAPESPGGKTFAGTGDTSFAVSEGQTRNGRIEGSEAAPAPAPATPQATPAPAATPKAGTATPAPTIAAASPAAATGGVGVQIGAYSSAADAEKGWTVLSGRNSVLSGLKHRVVEGRADIGTVFRLQAVTTDVASANDLCAKLKAAGQGCQVKR